MTIFRELLARVGLDVRREDFDKAESAVGRIKQRMQGAAGTVEKLRQGVLGAVGAYLGFNAVVGAGRAILDANVQYEKLQAQLYTIEGSAEAASASFERLQGFAVSTPFELNNITEAFIQMRVRGMEASDRTLRALGDTMAAFGLDITDAGVLVGQLMAGETEAFKRLGGQASVSGDMITLQFGDLKRTIKKDAASIEAFLVELGENNFAGAMERQANTLGGIISNIQDALFQLMIRIGESGLNGALKRLLRIIVATTDGSGGLAEQLGGAMAKAVDGAVEAFQFLTRHSRFAKLALGGLAAVLAAVAASALAANIQLFAIPATIVLLAALVDDFLGWLEGRPSLIGDLLGPVEDMPFDVRAAFDQVQGIVEGAVSAGLRIFGRVQQLFSAAWPIAVRIFERVAALVVGHVQWAMGMIEQYVIPTASKIWGFIVGIVRRFIPVAGAIWGALLGIVETAVPIIRGIVEEIWGIISDFLDPLIEAAVQIYDGVASFVEDVYPKVASIISRIARIIWPFIRTSWRVMSALISSVVKVVVPIAARAIKWAFKFLGTMLKLGLGFLDWLLSLWEKYISPFVEWVAGLVDKAIEGVGGFLDWLMEAWKGFADWFESLFDDPLGKLSGAFRSVLTWIEELLSGIGIDVDLDGSGSASGLQGIGSTLQAAGVGGTSNTSNTSVDTVNVTIPGSTNMGPTEMERSVRDGVKNALDFISPV